MFLQANLLSFVFQRQMLLSFNLLQLFMEPGMFFSQGTKLLIRRHQMRFQLFVM